MCLSCSGGRADRVTILQQFDAGVTAALSIGAAWLLLAVWAVVRSIRISAQAKLAQAWGLRLRGLLSTTPGAYLICGDQGRVTASDTLRHWLGLGGHVRSFEELGPEEGAGLEGAGFTELESAISATAVSGVPFNLSIRTADGRRLFRAEGSSAPPEVAGNRGVVVWFSDLTDTAERLRSLEVKRQQEQEEYQAARGVVEMAPIPIWRRNTSLDLVEVNQAYADAVGASPQDVIARGIELLGASPDIPAREAAARVRDTGELLMRDEYAIAGGERRRFRIAELRLPNDHVAGLAIDLTDVDLVQARYDRFAVSQTEMFELLSAGVAVFGPDRLLMSANQAFLRIFRMDEEFVASNPEFDRVFEFMREARRLPEQRDFRGWKAERRNWFLMAERSIEETWVLPDNMVIRVIAQPGPDGGLLLIFEDQSERLKLASSREQLMRVQGVTLQNLREAVAVFSASGRLQFHNDAFRQLWRIPKAVLTESPQVDVLFREARVNLKTEALSDLMRRLVQAGTEGRSERNGRLELDDDRYVRFAAVPLPDGNALCTFDDITDTERVDIALRDRTEALQAADEAKSRFVENMSYELRTPLTAIAGFGEMLGTGLVGTLSERQQDYVNSILTSAERLGVMINSIIDLAASDVGALSLNAEKVRTRALIETTIQTLSGFAKDRNITVSHEVAEGAEQLVADPVRLGQALYNLLANALRFTPEEGQVTVSVRRKEETISITVEDTGIGIPEADRTKVFDRFFKASNAAQTSGVGLGLALVKEVAELHGGSIELRSKVGRGTAAELKLPLRDSRLTSQVAQAVATVS